MEFINSTTNAVTAAEGSAIAPALAKKNPTDFLKQVIGKPVIVKLYSGVTYKGNFIDLVDDDSNDDGLGPSCDTLTD